MIAFMWNQNPHLSTLLKPRSKNSQEPRGHTRVQTSPTVKKHGTPFISHPHAITMCLSLAPITSLSCFLFPRARQWLSLNIPKLLSDIAHLSFSAVIVHILRFLFFNQHNKSSFFPSLLPAVLCTSAIWRLNLKERRQVWHLRNISPQLSCRHCETYPVLSDSSLIFLIRAAECDPCKVWF